MQELWFLRSACRLMLINIYIKFCEDTLDGFQVIEWIQFYDRQSFKENNSKSINARVMVLRSAHCLMLIDIYMYMRFREDSLNGFQVTEQTRMWQTDRRSR